MRSLGRYALIVLAVALSAASLIPLVPTEWWWVRLLDFPRLPFAAGLVALGFGLLFFLRRSPRSTASTLALVAIALAVNGWILRPYLPTGGLPVDAAVLNSLIIAATKVPATVLTLVPAGQLPALSVSSLQTLLNSTLTSLPVQPGEVLALVQGTASGSLSMIPLGTLPSTAALTSSLTGAIPPQLMGTVVSVVRMVPVATVTRTVSGAVNKLSVSTIAQTVSATANVLPTSLLGMSNTITALLPTDGGSANSDAHSSLLLITGLDIDLLGAVKLGVGISLTAP